WGLWAERSTITAHLDDAGLSRLTRGGIQPMTTEQGLALFDAAARLTAPLVIPARLEFTGLSRSGRVPSLLRDLVTSSGTRPIAAPAAAEGLAAQLAVLNEADREQALLKIVRTHAAAVLGHSRPESVEPQQAFRELGFDSLTALELRNRLSNATGLRLPATLVFDHPAPIDLTRHLDSLLAIGKPTTYAPDQIFKDLGLLKTALSHLVAEEGERVAITNQLQSLLAEWKKTTQAEDSDSVRNRISTASDEDILDFVGKEFGIS
ncbi:beta-ketoacyl reductase, partial [Streptomyces sp. NPDC058307]|uniref:acyl carrier protein n=1 Tax=Streptomyces sp. NPDC058307 TaxID=3346439 RepID=UPI0036E9C406